MNSFDSLFPIQYRFGLIPQFLKHLLSNHLVDEVVFGKQDPDCFISNRGLFFDIVCDTIRRLVVSPAKHIKNAVSERRLLYRFGQEGGKTGLFKLSGICSLGKRGQYDQRDTAYFLISFHLFGKEFSSHVSEALVDKDHMKGRTVLRCLFQCIERSFRTCCNFGLVLPFLKEERELLPS